MAKHHTGYHFHTFVESEPELILYAYLALQLGLEIEGGKGDLFLY